MYYQEIMQQRGEKFDPFLHIKKQEIVEETNNFFVIPARSPYTKDHLLIIPKKQVNMLKELTTKEKSELFSVVEDWTNKLHKKHNSVNLLLRDGLVGGRSGKSVNHLHFHLIPDMEIGSKDTLAEKDRPWYSDSEYAQISQEIIQEYQN